MKGQQSGIGPECAKNIAKNIFVKDTNNSDYSFVDGEIEWLLNDRGYDVVALFVADYHYGGSFHEIHWATNTPPFIHSIVRGSYNELATDIKTIPPVAISNLLHDLGYSTAPNNMRVLMDEVWINHKVEAIRLENTIGTGLNDELPCLVAIGDMGDEDRIDEYFSSAQEADSQSGFRDSMNQVNDLPTAHAMTILLFRQGFGMEWQKKLNSSFGHRYFECDEYDTQYFGNETLSKYHELWGKMMSPCGRESEVRKWLFNLGDIQIINPLIPFLEWLNKELKTFAKREIDSVDYYIMSGVEREQLAEDATLKKEKLCTIADFKGLADNEISWGSYRIKQIMEELCLEPIFWSNFVRYDQNSSRTIEAFTRNLFRELDEKDISLPRIVDTWH